MSFAVPAEAPAARPTSRQSAPDEGGAVRADRSAPAAMAGLARRADR
jgi:hypothetical protein